MQNCREKPDKKKLGFGIDSLLLRGCTTRNTDESSGIVVYAGTISLSLFPYVPLSLPPSLFPYVSPFISVCSSLILSFAFSHSASSFSLCLCLSFCLRIRLCFSTSLPFHFHSLIFNTTNQKNKKKISRLTLDAVSHTHQTINTRELVI